MDGYAKLIYSIIQRAVTDAFLIRPCTTFQRIEKKQAIYFLTEDPLLYSYCELIGVSADRIRNKAKAYAKMTEAEATKYCRDLIRRDNEKTMAEIKRMVAEQRLLGERE